MKKIMGLLVSVVLILLAGTVCAEDFSADILSSAAGKSFQGKVFYSKEKVRMEMPQAVTITRLDKHVMWMIVSGQNVYVEMPLQPGSVIPTGDDKVPGEIERKLLGTETIDGKAADKYRIVYSLENKKQAMLCWIANGSNFPIKATAEDGSWSVEYRNVQVGAQPASLFEVPSGYQKMQMTMPSLSEMQNMMNNR